MHTNECNSEIATVKCDANAGRNKKSELDKSLLNVWQRPPNHRKCHRNFDPNVEFYNV